MQKLLINSHIYRRGDERGKRNGRGEEGGGGGGGEEEEEKKHVTFIIIITENKTPTITRGEMGE